MGKVDRPQGPSRPAGKELNGIDVGSAFDSQTVQFCEHSELIEMTLSDGSEVDGTPRGGEDVVAFEDGDRQVWNVWGQLL
jgi:hypothetical protein